MCSTFNYRCLASPYKAKCITLDRRHSLAYVLTVCHCVYNPVMDIEDRPRVQYGSQSCYYSTTIQSTKSRPK